jgi:threonine dehydrogenase-like Zn-dependent dehydrogenase
MSATSMRAAVMRGGRLVTERLERRSPAPGEVRVRLRVCGICGTDLSFHGAGLFADGHVPGHEMFGEIDLVGDGVEHLAPGDPVAIEPLSACGVCDVCLGGRPNICRDVQLFGIHRAGGFAESICVPAERAFPVPRDLDPALAALCEPTAVAIHGIRRGGLEPGQRVLVLGAGTIGLLGVVAARRAGAGEVWLTARHPHQAELGRALGATRILSDADATPEGLDALGREAPIDLALETVGGAADTLHVATAAIRPGGTVSVLGVFEGDVSVPSFALLLKEGTLAWSNCYERRGPRPDFDDAVALLDAERTALAALETHAVSLDEAERGIAIAKDKTSGAVKVTIRCDA